MDENIGKIAERMALVNAEIEAVVKDQQGQGLPYKFRSIYGIYKMVHPILAKHKVFIVPVTLYEKRTVVETEKSYYDTSAKKEKTKKGVEITTLVRVRYEFTTDDNSHIDIIMSGEGVDYSDKSLNKAYTSAMKNALVQAFTIPDEMDVSDSEYDDIEMQGKGGKSGVKTGENKQGGKPPATTNKTEPASSAKDNGDKVKDYKTRIEACKNIFEIKAWGEKHKDEIKKLSKDDQDKVRGIFSLTQGVLQKEQDADKLAQLTGKPITDIKAFMNTNDLWGDTEIIKALKGDAEAIATFDEALDGFLAEKAVDLLGNDGAEHKDPA